MSLDTTVVAAPTGGTTSIVKSQAGYYGKYKIYIAAPIYEDALPIFPSWKKKHFGLDGGFALDVLSRSDVAAVNRSATGGLFIVDKKDAYKTVGGITATYDGTKFMVSLTSGLTAGSKP